MSLKRRSIRKAIVELLKDNTAAKDRVTSNRSEIPQWEKSLPAISVYTRADPARIWAESPRTYIRSARIVVEVWLDTTDESIPVDDDLDEICGQIEDLINPRLTAFAHLFGLHVTETTYEGVEVFAATLEGMVPLSGARLVWVMAYVQEIDELDEAEVEAWLRTHVEWDMDTDVTGPEATDDIDMP